MEQASFDNKDQMHRVKPLPLSDASGSGTGGLFVCLECGERCEKSIDAKRHERDEHGNDDKPRWIKRYRMNGWSDPLVDKHNYKDIKKVSIDGDYYCNSCDMRFSNDHSLKLHHELKHDKTPISRWTIRVDIE